jgi:hypothetical protein
MKIFCRDYDKVVNESASNQRKEKFSDSAIYMLKDGKIVKRKYVKTITEDFLHYLINQFDLRKRVDSTIEHGNFKFINI